MPKRWIGRAEEAKTHTPNREPRELIVAVRQVSQPEIEVQLPNLSLVEMVRHAADRLASATSAAEVLEARDAATLVYDAAKRAARMAKAKEAHDEVIAKVHRAQADALEIECQAKARLADEYDRAQERGEVQKPGGDRTSIIPDENNAPAKVTEIGLTSKQVHEARQIRDAEPGLIRTVLDVAIKDNKEPTRAHVMHVLNGGDKPRTVKLGKPCAEEPEPEIDPATPVSSDSLARKLIDIVFAANADSQAIKRARDLLELRSNRMEFVNTLGNLYSRFSKGNLN